MNTSMIFVLFCLFGLIVLAGVIFLSAAFKNIPENEKWVVTRFGRTTVKGPGRIIQIPLIDQVIKVDMSEMPTKIQDQMCITKDLVPVIIHMIIYSRVIEPIKYSSLTKQHREDFVLLSSSTLKELISTWTLDEVLSARDELGSSVCDKLNSEIDPDFGMRIEKVKLIDIVVSKEVLASINTSTKKIPTSCPSCGAPILSQGHKGKEEIKCEYCGYLIKL
jgi:regulator of protease activity HflC (stomatin/prohibitin superfamily)